MKRLFLNFVLLFVISCNLTFGQTIKIVPSSSQPEDSERLKKKAAEIAALIGLTGEKAPSFTVTGMGGTVYNLEGLRGKIIVLNLWGTFCPPCIEEIPQLNALVDKYKGREVIFLAATSEEKTTIDEFLSKNPFKYQVLPDASTIILQYEPKKKDPEKKGGLTLLFPVHLVIDQQGMVVQHFWGYKPTTANDLSQTIEQLLAKKT